MIKGSKNIQIAHAALLNAYLDGNLDISKQEKVEALVAQDPELASLFREKGAQREELRTLIPNKKIPEASLISLKFEMRQVENDLFADRKNSLLEKFAKVLDTTILEF